MWTYTGNTSWRSAKPDKRNGVRPGGLNPM
jgi:hypothetical protein